MRIEITTPVMSYAYSNLAYDADGELVETTPLNGYGDRTDFYIEVAIYLINNGIEEDEIVDEDDKVEATWKFIKD